MIIPKPLFRGARVALVGTSGPVEEDRLDSAVKAVAALGLIPVVYESCRERHGFLAGTDERRAGDLNAAFADRSIDGILSIRGGYGAARILPLLDLDMIRRNAKFFSGYSDVTALHTAFNQTCGFVTYHTPMPSTELYKGLDAYTARSLDAVLFGRPVGELTNPPDEPLRTLVPGRARGTLCGGNLSLLAASIGTPYEIDTRGKILFIEDVGEKEYCIDGMLTQLRNSGKLRACAGIVFGAFTDCESDQPELVLSLAQILDELVATQGVPAVTGLRCGHCLPTLSLPLGMEAELDAQACTLAVLP